MAAIKLVVLDVDGVLCDGKIYDETGKAYSKIFNDLDFTAIKCFKALGIPVVFLTSDPFNIGIAKERNIVFKNGRNQSGIIDKGSWGPIFESEYGVTRDEILYVGDDRFDIPLLEYVGWAFCPSNSPECVKGYCHVLKGRSGQNLVSEIFEYLLGINLIQEPNLRMLMFIDAEESKK